MFSMKQSFNLAVRFFIANFYKIFFVGAVFVFLERLIVFSNVAFAGSVLAAGASTAARLFAQMFVLIVPTFFEALIIFFLTAGSKFLHDNGSLRIKNFFPSAQKIAAFIYGFIVLIFPMFIAVLLFFAVTSDSAQKFLTESSLISISIALPFLILAAGVFISALMSRYVFFYFGVLDGLSLADSFRKSARLTLLCRKKLFLLLILLALFNALGFALIAGSLFTLPLSALTMMYVYFELTKPAVEETLQDRAFDVEDEIMGATQKEKI